MPEARLEQALRDRLEARRGSVAVIGLGYVGLPLAVAIAEAGFAVVGIDANRQRVELVNSGRSHIGDISDHVLAGLVESGKLSASTSYGSVTEADVAVIAVPTPIDEHRTPDLSFVRAAVDSVAEVISRGSLVVLESTTYPGTTEEVVVPALERRGLSPGQDVFVGYSPERIDPGNRRYTLSNTAKVVAGLDERCLELTVTFYAQFVETVVAVSNLKTAEMTKLFENIFRIVNIALVNELQMTCDRFGIDVWEVIDACSTKPYGYMPFYPGPGLGGHCVPVDPFYLAWKAREVRGQTEFIELAGRINSTMPEYVVGKIVKALNGRRAPLAGSRIGLLGVAYKKNTSDVRESPAIPIVEQLLASGAVVSYHDPHVPVFEVNGDILLSQALTEDYLREQDCIVVVADHDAMEWPLILRHAGTVVDTRNALKRVAALSGQLREPVPAFPATPSRSQVAGGGVPAAGLAPD
ncbi:MAG: UDP-N-acetyl-D-glucosamine dehydrogenase [Candidatus Nephthysia bennettiae]|uniref:Nucleotide sugar dehydrogenase n=1 Tax=Candidatus Nephthysia bennettiae TaxID=3127016 RepID=A0A934K8W2_9BACT|nr:nucleotide sugar dehydrogenase [Candidatus Dormibacteraeota bacterium]PZR99803.1 MAG: UDP-N-acetyl-D-glucosamine dehydrogenase [Candidatus Dormibacteraeota bacterium]